jgi:putative endopeptidase
MRVTGSLIVRCAAIVALAVLAVYQLDAGASAPPATGVDAAAIDRTCKPCDDFYQFATGAWQKATKLPADKSSYGVFDILGDRNIAVVHQLLDEVSAANQTPGSNAQKVADFYGSCMNTAAIDQAGLSPITPDLDAVNALAKLDDLPALVARLELDGVDVFAVGASTPDYENSSVNLFYIYQAGLGLPDRDYYTKDDAKSADLRAKYQAYVAHMLGLTGESAAAAAADAQTVMTIETALAQHQLTRVQRRDVKATANKRTVAQLDALSPNFHWSALLAALNVDAATVGVESPDYVGALSGLLPGWSIDQIKTYLRWHVLNAHAQALPTAFEDANFAFYRTTLRGQAQPDPRWKRCAYSVDENVGEALGQLYVAKAFPPQAKREARAMVDNIESVFREDLQTLSWMSPQTRQHAIAKLDAFLIKIGYPDKWRDYSALSVGKVPYAANLIAAERFENQRELAQVGKPVDRTEWGMTPPTVNAYYDPSVNEIVFPAGILQPPFFDPSGDVATNYGAIGAVIGHESTHGFDDQGSLYDKDGNLNDQWTPADRAAFDAKTACIVNQFDQLSPLPGVHETGKLVVGEATADLGGVTIAYKAFERWQSAHPRVTIGGFTPEQRFFLAWAQTWRSVQSEAYTRLLATTDPHPYDKFRANATVSNLEEFAKAWQCPLTAPMVRPPADRCKIW